MGCRRKPLLAQAKVIWFIWNTYRYRSQFDEPNDDWLEAIEATSEELLEAYTKVEDEAMNTAFGARGKKRLNRVFDVIGFVYHDFWFLARKQGTKRKIATMTSAVSKPKRTKVVTHRSKSYFFRKSCYTACCRGFKDKGCRSYRRAPLSFRGNTFLFFLVLNRRMFNLMLLLGFLNRWSKHLLK